MLEIRMDKYCPHCRAKIVEYRHSLSRPMFIGLAKIMASGGLANLKELFLTRNQWDNFQKLRYFNLVKQVRVDGHRRRGTWAITSLGRLFLEGRASVPKSVWTYRGETVRCDPNSIYAHDVDPGYRKREDYAADAQPHLFG